MKKQISLLFFIFLILISGKTISRTSSDSLPLYQNGKLYFQLKSTSNVVIKHKDTIVNDPGGSFHTLFTKYQVSKTERPYAILNTSKLNKTYRISFNQTARVDSFVLELSQISSDIEFAEKVPAVYTFSVPNELTIPTPQASALYHLPLLNANSASNLYISNGNAVVAIVDDAILTTHEDLVANLGSSASTWTDVADGDNDPNPPLMNDDAGGFTHGTHVAGIAGAVTNNSVGVASIGWNSKLMCVKTVSDNASPQLGLTNAYEGVAWAAAHGARVINMSWGGLAFSQAEYNVLLSAKVANDIVLVAAAGNNGNSIPIYPAAYGEGTTGQSWEGISKNLVVAVASLDQNSNISSWGTTASSSFGSTSNSGSNYGHWVDISAYGTDIMSTLAGANWGTPINNQYGTKSGTSMAAPQVSGIAGLMRSFANYRTADEIINCLIYTANPDIYGSSHPTNQPGTLGSGRADAYAALRCLTYGCSPSPVAIIAPSSQSLCPSSTVTLSANQGAGGAYTCSWSTGATTPSISINTAGTYSLVVNYFSGCSATAAINVPNADLTAHIDIIENSGLAGKTDEVDHL